VSCLMKFLASIPVLGLLASAFVIVLQLVGWSDTTLLKHVQWHANAPSQDSNISLTFQAIEQRASYPDSARVLRKSSRDGSASGVPLSQIPKQHKNGWWENIHRDGDLPALPDERSPDDASWDNGIALCACMREENTTDIREWILYHRCASMMIWFRPSCQLCCRTSPTPL
jgi:hypothetical protein